MKIWMAIAVMMFAAVGHAGKAEARYLDGNALLENCEGESAADKTTCYGNLMGIEDTVDLYYNLGRLNKGWCIPDGVSAGQLITRRSCLSLICHLKAKYLDAQ